LPNLIKTALLEDLTQRFGNLRKLSESKSLFVVGNDAARLYLRYSKTHQGGRTFFGLRQIDLRELEGRNAFICFYTDDDSVPLFVPFADFEEVFHSAEVASDGQYKVQIVAEAGTRELYIPKIGRFNLDGYAGADTIANRLDSARLTRTPNLSHCQVQTLLAAIGYFKGYDVFIPSSDVCTLDWGLARRFPLRDTVPSHVRPVERIICEIDVLWIDRTRNVLQGLFEVEHSTPVYSGLLRFNDVLLTFPDVTRFFVVSNDARRDLFVRQTRRPTFVQSGLSELTSFLEYANVYDWFQRLAGSSQSPS
jgi:hypothetical protein